MRIRASSLVTGLGASAPTIQSPRLIEVGRRSAPVRLSAHLSPARLPSAGAFCARIARTLTATSARSALTLSPTPIDPDITVPVTTTPAPAHRPRLVGGHRPAPLDDVIDAELLPEAPPDDGRIEHHALPPGAVRRR